ncbi:MAG: hypothetical protein VKO65_07590, partial [Cyanobacteriota bacterium]|nr:hypothetical protein [Cyanobacteriota bacterium]
MASASLRRRLRAGSLTGLRRWLADRLINWAAVMEPDGPSPSEPAPPPPQPKLMAPRTSLGEPPLMASCPGLREPLSVEEAVLRRDLSLLKREAADALAALGSAHALVASARLAEVQSLRERLRDGEEGGDRLMALAGDYQGWQADQVRLFDALALVLRMRV